MIFVDINYFLRSVENLWIMRKVFFFLLFMVLILPSIGLTTLRWVRPKYRLQGVPRLVCLLCLLITLSYVDDITYPFNHLIIYEIVFFLTYNMS